MNSVLPRSGSGRLADGWSAKADYLPHRVPLGQRPWVRRLAFCLACGVGLAAALALAAFDRWYGDYLSDLERQRHRFDAFCGATSSPPSAAVPTRNSRP